LEERKAKTVKEEGRAFQKTRPGELENTKPRVTKKGDKKSEKGVSVRTFTENAVESTKGWGRAEAPVDIEVSRGPNSEQEKDMNCSEKKIHESHSRAYPFKLR